MRKWTTSPPWPDLVPEGALVVANNSKVLPARLFGHKASGGRVEFLLLTPLPLIQEAEKPLQPTGEGWHTAEVMGLLRASKGPRPGDVVTFADDLRLIVHGRGEFGRASVRLDWQGDLATLFVKYGHYPLPPYIRRPDTPEDALRYQTVYADQGQARLRGRAHRRAAFHHRSQGTNGRAGNRSGAKSRSTSATEPSPRCAARTSANT